MIIRVAIGTACIVFGASFAHAQSDSSRWGVAVSLAPSWNVPTGSGPLGKLAEFVHEAGDLGLDITGSDFRIGVVRGRRLGGDWGVSFVRRTFDDGSTQGGVEESCFDSSGPGGTTRQCSRFGTQYLYQSVTLSGMEANKFLAIGTIAQAVQIGVDLAGGFGALKGSAERRDVQTTFEFIRNAQGQIIGQRPVDQITSEIVDARELTPIDPTLLGRVELAVAGILPGGVKVRVSGGMNFPGAHTFSITGLYFIGGY